MKCLDEMICETCGAPAKGMSRDIQEIHPAQDADGFWWASWESKGEWHFWCWKHERPSKSHMLPAGSYNILQPEGLPACFRRDGA